MHRFSRQMASKARASKVKNKIVPSVFAKPTSDVAFKHMLKDAGIVVSFLEVFTGKKISEVTYLTDALPTLKRDADEKQTFLDLACKDTDGDIFISEVQVKKQNFWDARALYYLTGVYSRQLSPDQKWPHLRPVVGINILDHDSKTMAPGIFEKDYSMVDRYGPVNNAISTLPWIRLVQVELPRVDLSTVSDVKKREWLNLLRNAGQSTSIPSGSSDVIAQAYLRLEKRSWNGQLIADYEKERMDWSNYSQAIGEIRMEGQVDALLLQIESKMVKVEDILKLDLEPQVRKVLLLRLEQRSSGF